MTDCPGVVVVDPEDGRLTVYVGTRATAEGSEGAPSAPTLVALPLITKGPNKGERWMNKPQFAAWCGVAVATVSDWIYTGRVVVTKRGDRQQSRVLIASGERERLRPPAVNRKKGGNDA